jgi:hypothetical protein
LRPRTCLTVRTPSKRRPSIGPLYWAGILTCLQSTRLFGLVLGTGPCHDPGEPAPWPAPGYRRTGTRIGCAVQQAGGRPRRFPGEPVNLPGPEAAPARKPAAIPSCSASTARCGRLGSPPARRKRRTLGTPRTPSGVSSPSGSPHPPTQPTDCPLTGSAVRQTHPRIKVPKGHLETQACHWIGFAFFEAFSA